MFIKGLSGVILSNCQPKTIFQQPMRLDNSSIKSTNFSACVNVINDGASFGIVFVHNYFLFDIVISLLQFDAKLLTNVFYEDIIKLTRELVYRELVF